MRMVEQAEVAEPMRAKGLERLLTRRERQIVALIAKGHSNQQIAASAPAPHPRATESCGSPLHPSSFSLSSVFRCVRVGTFVILRPFPMPPPQAAPVPASFSGNGEALYLAHRSLIDDVVRFVVRRRGLRDDDAEEFAASVRLRLVESGYDILKQFEGRSSLRTYLTVADTARTLGLDQKRLYRTIAHVLAALREGLEAEGIRSAGAPPLEDVRAAANPARRGHLSGREQAPSEQ